MLTRRRVLAAGASMILGWLLGMTALTLRPIGKGTRPTDADTQTRRRHTVLGRAYLQRHPHEALPTRLAEVVPEDPLVRNRQVRADFAAGRVVILGGWILSLTECRYCALQAIARMDRG